MVTDELVSVAGKFLGISKKEWNLETVSGQPVSPDGSLRLFVRLSGPGGQRLLVIQPPVGDSAGLLEAHSCWEIGRHLYTHGIAVPELYGFERNTGRLFVEDLGDQRLHELLQGAGEEEQLQWYTKVVRELVRMQVLAVEYFSQSWCWDTPSYDIPLMLNRESGYFIRALCVDFFDLSFDHQQVDAECRLLAGRAGDAPGDFFLHRDFQSRNLMVKDGRVRIIDYQGGRCGPLAYDLASLLIDPYMRLSAALQQKIKAEYIKALQEYVPYDPEQFEREYIQLGLQRNMQILGAFAFLSRQRQKPFFGQFIEPALCSLNSLLAKPDADDYVALRELAGQCLLSAQDVS